MSLKAFKKQRIYSMMHKHEINQISILSTIVVLIAAITYLLVEVDLCSLIF